MCVLVTHSCPALCDSKDCSLPDSSACGILQARILELPFSSPGDLPDPVFPIQGSNPGFLHCRWIYYHLSHQESL